MAQVFAVASAKGGVGKTTTTANVGAILAETGADVVVIDGDISMANLGAALGIESPPTTLHDVLRGDATPSEATYEGPGGVYVVPGDTALSSYASADPAELPSVLRTHSQADYVLIDVGAGVSHETGLPLSLADEVLLVSTPERDALRDTEKTRQLTEELGGTVAGAVITRTEPSTPVSELATGTLAAPVLGSIPEDEAVRDSVAVGEPLSTYAPHSPAAEAYRELVAELTGVEPAAPADSDAPSTTPPAEATMDSESADTTTDSEPADTPAEPTTAADTDSSLADTGSDSTPTEPDPTSTDTDAEPADTAADHTDTTESTDTTDTSESTDNSAITEAEEKWAEAATGTAGDVDDAVADEATSLADADGESSTPAAEPPADDATSTTEPDEAMSTSTDDDADADPLSSDSTDDADDAADGEPELSPSDPVEEPVSVDSSSEIDEGAVSEPPTEPIAEEATEADGASPVADLADEITEESTPIDADAAVDADSPPTPDAVNTEPAVDEKPSDAAVPFTDADDEPTDADEDPLIPDAEGESSPGVDDDQSMTTELGSPPEESTFEDTAATDDDDDDEKGFFRRLFFG
ncbi:cell division ATPase MinD [Halonotius roseus]|uniref:Cobyrinic acid ac-diamide synthase n=1 Tax=Halonotius roseus TaxID=2511997 RepID=A0A544QR85_9EURY|nr:cell division ATPase MinD [Halonotius roseus]TQQ81955.1 cobyrinic acid ac-diamide synthase [Halonotius roseus]